MRQLIIFIFIIFALKTVGQDIKPTIYRCDSAEVEKVKIKVNSVISFQYAQVVLMINDKISTHSLITKLEENGSGVYACANNNRFYYFENQRIASWNRINFYNCLITKVE